MPCCLGSDSRQDPAIAALWILPAALLAGLGYLVYLILERLADKLGLT